jgi:Kdo2-lipid IVA lauroyltransferase/acyltransferase
MAPTLRTLRHELGYRALCALLDNSRRFSLATLRRGGAALGRLALLLQPRERRRALGHLALAFPEHDEAWRRGVVREASRHFGQVLGEVAWLWSAPPEALLARTEMVGLENLTAAVAPEGGPVLVTGHCGNWEWMNLAIGAAGVPMTVAAREVYDPRLDDIVRRLRGRFGGETVLRGQGAGQRLSRALRERRVLGMLIDQDIDAPGVFVEFFGQPAWTPSGAAVIALRSRRPLVPGHARRLADGSFRLTFEPPIVPHFTGDLAADAGRLTAVLTARIEAWVRDEPAQWVWMHRRWRRKPADGERVWSAADPAEPAPPVAATAAGPGKPG